MKKIFLLIAAVAMTVSANAAIYLCDKWVNDAMIAKGVIDSLNSLDGVTATGSITFNAAMDTMTFDNVTIVDNVTDEAVLRFNDQLKLTIVLKGTNRLSATNTSDYPAALKTSYLSLDTVTFVGENNSARLICESNNYYPIYMQGRGNGLVTFKNLTLKVDGKEKHASYGGICDNNPNGTGVAFINANVSMYKLVNIKKVTLTDCAITAPEGATLDETSDGYEINKHGASGDIRISRIPVVYDTIAYTYAGNTLYYKITQKNALANKVSIINDGVHQPSGAVIIPNIITDWQGTEYRVEGMWASVFADNTAITSLDFSENTYITSTSQSMCDGCSNLTSIILSDYITKIFGYGFRGCPLSSIDLKNVKEIEMANFHDVTFTTVHIPASLEKIEDNSYLCYHVTTVTCDAGNTHFAAVDNVLYSKDLTKVIALPGGYAAEQEVRIVPTATSMAYGAFRGFNGKLYINSEISCDDHGWANSPSGAVIVGCGLYTYYSTGEYAGVGGGTTGDFRSVTSLTEELQYKITITAENGTVLLSDTTDCNQVKLTATPNSGYKFLKWADNESTDAVRIITVTADVALTALFDVASGLDETETNTKATKRLVNGQLFIEKNGKTFNAQGIEVK